MCFFAFYAEIHDGRQNDGKVILGKVTSRLCRYPANEKFRRNRSILHRFQDKCIFAFYAEIQDGCQKWWENEFWEKPPVHSTDVLQVKNFVEIALSHTVSEINLCLHFTQKFKMVAKNGGKTIFGKSPHVFGHVTSLIG